ncbi:MAG: NAD(P)/FAD-dependent oxidoreductase [Pontimonas sp.]
MHSTVFDRNQIRDETISHSLASSVRKAFWVEDAGRDSSLTRFAGSVDCDLTIVGAGYTGLWTAIEAKRRHPDWRVVVLEAKDPGWAASGRNGGFVESTLTHGESNGRRRYPKEYEVLDQAGLENLDAIEAAVKKFGWDCDFWRVGSLAVAVEEHELEWLDESADGEREVRLSAEETRARVNSPTYLGATFSPRDTAMVHPGKLAREMLRTVKELGVEVFRRSPVKGLEASAHHVELRLASGVVRAQRVALATNAYPSLLKRYRLHTIPVYDYVLMTEPLNNQQKKEIGWSGGEGVADLANQFHYYRITADDRILFGGYDAIYHFGGRVRSGYEERPESYRKLASHFFTTFPQLEGVQFSHRWAGAIDTCSRFSAFFATAHNSRVAYAAGFTGLGVAATRFAAEVMLDQLEGESTWRTELEMVKSLPIPFPPEPLCYPAVQLTRTALDRADHREGKRGLFLRTLDAVGLGFDS